MHNEHRIAKLEHELAQVRGHLAALHPATPAAAPVATSRRSALKLAAATALGAVGSTALVGRAAADQGFTVAGAVPTLTAQRATIVYTGAATSNPAFMFMTNTGVSGDIWYSSALAGITLTSSSRAGVYGYSNQANGQGVCGEGVDGPGVLGFSSNADGVSGSTTVGAGIAGSGDVGGRFMGATSAMYLVAPQGHQSPLDSGISGETGYLDVDENGNFWACVTGGAPSTWRKLAGADTAGSFHPITPTRVYDSREPLPTLGALSSGQHRLISVRDARAVFGGGVTVTDAIPVGATAVAANITVTRTVGRGYLVVNPGGNTVVNASTINWFATGQTLANGVILALNGTRELTVVCAGSGSTDFVVDITGYYL